MFIGNYGDHKTDKSNGFSILEMIFLNFYLYHNTDHPLQRLDSKRKMATKFFMLMERQTLNSSFTQRSHFKKFVVKFRKS